MPSEIRIKRIQDQTSQVLIEILDGKVNDPRLEQVYITDVTIDRELDLPIFMFQRWEVLTRHRRFWMLCKKQAVSFVTISARS